MQRAFEQGTELVKCRLPALLTVVASANQPRPASARKRIQYKLAAAPNEYPLLLKKYPEFGELDDVGELPGCTSSKNYSLVRG